MSTGSTFGRLTLFNLRHLVTSPVFFLIMPPALFAPVLTSQMLTLPTASGFHRYCVYQAMCVAVVMFVVTSFPAIREVRHSAGLALPLSPRARLLSLALAAVALASVCTAIQIVGYLVRVPVPIAGVLSPYAVPGVIVTSWFGPLAALATVVWTRSFAPLIAFVLLIPAYLVYTSTTMGRRADVIVNRVETAARSVVEPLPVTTPGVTALAVLYLLLNALLAVLLLTAAMARRDDGRGVRPVTAAVSALLAVVIAVTGVQANRAFPFDAEFSVDQLHGTESAPCRTRDGVAYCPLPGYESWVEYWHAALAPVVAAAPERVRPRVLTVWQAGGHIRRSLHSDPPEHSIIVTEYWDTEMEFSREGVSVDAAVLLVGLPRDREEPCSASGQARLAVGAWLASADEGLSRRDRISVADSLLTRFDSDADGFALAHALMDLPRERVTAVLEEHWDTLTDPGTGPGELTELLDLPEPGSAEFPDADWQTSVWSEEEVLSWTEFPFPDCD
ncbi:hypothetical protein ACWFMI_11210 [Nocardiopsis terrae]